MKKLFILSLIAPAVLGLAACGGQKDQGNVVSNDVVLNADDANLTADVNATDANTVDANATVPVANVANAN
ncbi:MAG: circumsporozoite protein [Sphingomonas sp.]|uniref:circumsporozoite protein n=1 Tax=Sphingomonas sp. TaxID=28214 RepID=UPI0012049792|nr:circumsporozoite protein [Sphingomonas sp.]THD35046.1 MAG: circumsporozoite protein [Sphingomonas sp.]